MPKAVKVTIVCTGAVCLLALGAMILRPAPPVPPAAPGAGQRSSTAGTGAGTGTPGPGPSSGPGPGSGSSSTLGSVSGGGTGSGPGLLGGPGIAVEQGRFVGRSGGERRWEFDADEVRVREGESRVVLEGIRDGTLYDGGKPWLRFSAARGEADTATNNLTLEDVRFSSREGDVLTARTLTWSEKDQKVIIEGNVRVERDKGSVLVCERAEYHPGDNVLEAIGRTCVEIEVPED
ncbi:MAG: hypothetical protein PWR07_1748 [Bacillota bacterium]|nr:hypothetical protein [Bacillota bacterium]